MTNVRARAKVNAMTDTIVMLCTAPDTAVGEKLGRGLVEARLAACVSIVPGLTSIYRWKGEIQVDREVQLLIKTRADARERVRAWLRANHPYEVPEILELAVAGGSEPYLAWLREQVG